jgi:hypothetical protein
MKTLPRTLCGITAIALSSLLVLAPVSSANAQSSRPAPKVTIRVEMDLPDFSSTGPKVFQVSDVTAGPGIELTAANLVSNPSGWNGDVTVDVDPVTKAVTVAHGSSNTFQTVKVFVTSSDLTSLTNVNDTLFTAPPGAIARTVSGKPGAFEISWATSPVGTAYPVNGSAAFSYTTSFNTVTAAPGLTGRAKVGHKLKLANVSASNFTPAADRVAFQWYRGGKKIKHANRPAYRVKTADKGHRLRVRITVTGDGVPTLTYVLKTKKIKH